MDNVVDLNSYRQDAEAKAAQEIASHYAQTGIHSPLWGVVVEPHKFNGATPEWVWFNEAHLFCSCEIPPRNSLWNRIRNAVDAFIYELSL